METLAELIEKADYEEEEDIDNVPNKVKITTYESIIVKMSYIEYAKLRKLSSK